MARPVTVVFGLDTHAEVYKGEGIGALESIYTWESPVEG